MSSFHDHIMYRKRERTQNWSLEEKLYLLELVKSRLDVLENKRIDSASSAMKGLAWQDIHAGFAARFGSDRDAHRVREQWRRMKGQSRTEMLEFAERVRTYGAEVANQRRPSALAEEVWKTLELARRLNAFHQQSFGTGDDMGSPVNLDDEEDDTEDVMDAEGCHQTAVGGMGDRNVNGFNNVRHHDELVDDSRRGDRDRVAEDDARPRSRSNPGDPLDPSDAEEDPTARRLNSAATALAPGLMSMLRPKVELELNDVPEIDTSMVPSGLSITAVKIGGGSGPGPAKRRALERADASARVNCWGSPASVGSAPPSLTMPPMSVPNPAAGMGSGSLLESRRLEHRRRIEMMEEEHQAKMELLRVEKQTAEIRRRIAASDETTAFTCRACGEDKRLAVSTTGCRDREPGQEAEQEADGDVDASSIVTAASDVSRGSLGPGSGPGPGPDFNGIKEEDDNNNEDQVRYMGKGDSSKGGSAGAIREAGGAFGKREAAQEEQYFYNQQKAQLEKLKEDLTDEISFHEEQIKRHQEAITRHKQRVENLDKK